MATIITQAHVDRLEEALVMGLRKVRYPDKEVTYNSPEQMMKVLAYMRRVLDPKQARAQRVVFAHRSGLKPGADGGFKTNCR